MAFLRDERIEAEADVEKTAVSKRPVIAATLVVSAVVALVLGARQSAEPAKAELPAQFVLEPDHAGAARTLAAAESSLQVPSEPPPEAENLGVHPVPSLDGSGYESEPSHAGGPTTLVAAQQKMLEQHRLSTQQAELEAMTSSRNAPMRISSFTAHQQAQLERAAALFGAGGGDRAAGGLPSGIGDLGQLASLSAAPAMAALAGAAVPGRAQPAPQQDPMLSADKAAYFGHGDIQPGRLAADVELPESEFELQMGSIIPGVLISGINAEVPGQIIGQVSENVYDSATGRHLLVPQGSRLVGTYNATVATGQSRVQVAWTRLNLPDGRKLDLSGMPGTDQAGVSGFHDRVNRHFWARLAAAMMASAFTVTYEVTAPQNGNFYSSAVHRGVGESIVQLGVDIARQEGQRPPTLEIRPGYRFSISVTKDIVFPSAYEDGIARRTRRR